MFDANYGPLNEYIKSDIQRWNTIDFLDLLSRIESIRLNILPRWLYLFQSLPILIPQKKIVAWYRKLLKYIWNGKTEVKYKTLQLKKDNGGCGRPCLRECNCAAQIRLLICLCCVYYATGRKDVEGTIVKGVPVKALISDIKLQNKIHLPEEPILQVTLSAWNEAIKICGLENAS